MTTTATSTGRGEFARGRTDVPKIVDWSMNGKIEIDPMITYVLTLAEINQGFELMRGQVDPLGGGVLAQLKAKPT